MLRPFFAVAMAAPGRQLTFRRAVGLHVALLAALGWTAARSPTALTAVGYFALANR